MQLLTHDGNRLSAITSVWWAGVTINRHCQVLIEDRFLSRHVKSMTSGSVLTKKGFKISWMMPLTY